MRLPESVLRLCHSGVYTLYDIEPARGAVHLLVTPGPTPCCGGTGAIYALDAEGNVVAQGHREDLEGYRLVGLTRLPPLPRSVLGPAIEVG